MIFNCFFAFLRFYTKFKNLALNSITINRIEIIKIKKFNAGRYLSQSHVFVIDIQQLTLNKVPICCYTLGVRVY